MTIALELTHDEPRLVYLALVYHLGRPGSELDHTTLQPLEHGLRQVKTQLGNDLGGDSAVIEFDEALLPRFLSALFGAVSELRVMHMRGGGGSLVPRFSETAASLFPEIAADPAAALDVAEALVMLHRRVERAISRAERAGAQDPVEKRRRWPFKR